MEVGEYLGRQGYIVLLAVLTYGLLGYTIRAVEDGAVGPALGYGLVTFILGAVLLWATAIVMLGITGLDK